MTDVLLVVVVIVAVLPLVMIAQGNGRPPGDGVDGGAFSTWLVDAHLAVHEGRRLAEQLDADAQRGGRAPNRVGRRRFERNAIIDGP
jgi:hypothetical protein